MVLSSCDDHGKVPGSGSVGGASSLLGLSGKLGGPAAKETILTEGWLYRVSISWQELDGVACHGVPRWGGSVAMRRGVRGVEKAEPGGRE